MIQIIRGYRHTSIWLFSSVLITLDYWNLEKWHSRRIPTVNIAWRPD